jgi:hypothetical protein
MSDELLPMAERLISSGARYVEPTRLSAFARNYGLSRDDARRAAILADRLRRLQQQSEPSETLRVRPVPLDAPVVLQVKAGGAS